ERPWQGNKRRLRALCAGPSASGACDPCFITPAAVGRVQAGILRQGLHFCLRLHVPLSLLRAGFTEKPLQQPFRNRVAEGVVAPGYPCATCPRRKSITTCCREFATRQSLRF